MARPRLGVAYYPEQWPRERWAVDAELMAAAGLKVVRIGEFAWSQLEPRPGAFELDWLDEAVGVLAGAGLQVILGTPTAAPPAWLSERHPEVLPVRADGRMQTFGNRRHYCPNRPAMREATRAIVAVLGDRFGRDERVVAWQIDNELGGRCWCDACHAAFHVWLRGRYGSLDALNDAWGTAFWSQVYSGWAQIPLPPGSPVPLPGGFQAGSPNPGLALDFRRFSSDSLIGFLRLQARLLRERIDPAQRITHNLMGFRFAEIDYHALAEEIDVVSWDNYPLLQHGGHAAPALAAAAMRGLKDEPVWVLEQQVGPLGWEVLHTPRRGELRLHALQAIAHGAELVAFFRWRTARFGTEQFWHGVIEASGRVGRRYEELRALAAEVDELGERLSDARPRYDVALLHDYDSRFALQVQPTNPVLAYEETLQHHYEALRRLGLGVAVVSPWADLGAYPVVVAPSLVVMDEATAASLADYTAAGGLLVLGPRTAVRDHSNGVPERPLPAWLDELAGLEVVDCASLGADARARLRGIEGELGGWLEEVELRDGRALADYADGPFAGTPAIVEREVGWGRVVYVAGVARGSTLEALYRRLAGAAGLRLLELPDAVEAVPLLANGGELLFLLNHGDEQQVVAGVRLEPLGAALVEARVMERV